jgi:UDP-N-acetylmuramoylalanine--D-glutamate ligase
VLGLGVSGRAAAAFLLKRGEAVIGVDKRAAEIRSEVAPLIAQGLVLCDDASLDSVAQVVLSPGIPQVHPIVREAKERGIEVIGEIELAFRHFQNRCFGVTGSNGKTTTTLLAAHLLNRAGKKARALGNVGVGLSGYLLNPDPQEILIVELSSFQLETIRTRALDGAMILNITPNHLDRHASMEEYAAAKLSIRNCLKENGTLFLSRQVAAEYGPRLPHFTVYDAEDDLAPNSPIGYIQWGKPEREAVRAAFAIAGEFGVGKAECEKGLEDFRKPPHRIEWVAEIGGAAYYNDSKSSNLHSALHAVSLFEGNIVLIAGGQDKGSSYQPWIEPFRKKVKRLIAYGMAAPKMEAELSGSLPFERVGPFEEAVRRARDAAGDGDVVLLSPGCSSYDQFRSFEQRGDEFKRIVKEMEREWTEKKRS